MKFLKKYWYPIALLAVIAFAVYTVLDTFLITKVYQTGATQMNTKLFDDTNMAAADSTSNQEEDTAEDETASYSTEEPASEVWYDEDSYHDENISIEITQVREMDSDIYIADVQISSAEYLKTAFAEDTYGKNVRDYTSSIAAKHNAVFAVNGDFYGAQEKGYVIRNGVIYRDAGNPDLDLLTIYPDGTFGFDRSTDISANELLENGAWQTFSFGPCLVDDYQIMIDSSADIANSKGVNPRTAIGLVSPLHYIFVVVDGRTSLSTGLTLYDLAVYMQGLGCQDVYNLDGGGSATMYFMGNVVNFPTTYGDSMEERTVSDIVYIG